MSIYLLQGLVLGATAAAQPGPFQAFLLSLIARDGWRRTIPAALAPLVSDGPILALVLLVLTRLPAGFIPALQIVGGLYLLYLAWGAWLSFRKGPIAASELAVDDSARGNILKAALMNFLSPSPYIFWATVAGPIFLEAWRQAPSQGLAFLFGFYAALVGGIALFIVAFGGASQISPRVNRGLGALSAMGLFGFATYQLITGISGVGTILA